MQSTLKADNLRDFNELNEPLRVPINGKRYIIPPMGSRTAALLRRCHANDQAAIDELSAEPEVYFRALLGTAYDDMLADNVPEDAMYRASLAARRDWENGRVAAMQAWEMGDTPEALQVFIAATNRIANGDSTVTG